jgi:hypothetical protein
LIRHLLVAALFFCAAFGMGGCSNEVKVDENFVDLYIELRTAELTYGKDSPMARLVRQDALKAAGYTREQFLAKADEILNDERQWVPFQKAVTARLDALLEPPAEKPAAPAAPPSKPPIKKSKPSSEKGGND